MEEGIIGKLAANNLKLAQFCGFNQIELELKSKTKEGILKELSELLANSPNIDDVDSVYEALMEREHLASTGMGLGVAVPHGRSAKCKGELEYRTEPEEVLICHSCKLVYPVKDDIPVMLPDEAKPLDE